MVPSDIMVLISLPSCRHSSKTMAFDISNIHIYFVTYMWSDPLSYSSGLYKDGEGLIIVIIFLSLIRARCMHIKIEN